jgi:YVTN family beta-propeller protein
VANHYDNTVSVIDGNNNSNIGRDITVGKGPINIGVNPGTNTIYVVNSGNNSVSVIDGNNDSKIRDITVGVGAEKIGVNEDTNTIYVVNSGDNTVSVIDGETNNVLAKVMFNTEPFNTGHIECDKQTFQQSTAEEKIIAPLAQQFYLYSGTECTAKPNQGYEFVSWRENLNGNSTQLLQFSPPPTFLDSVLDFIHNKPDKLEAKLNITKFGSFTANFKALPPTIPAEYLATLFTVVVTAFVGSWLTPTVIEWRKTKNQGSKLDHYHNEIKNLYNDGRLDRNDVSKLGILINSITDEYTRGKINREQFEKLVDETSIKYIEIFTKELDLLKTCLKRINQNNWIK